MGKLFIRVFAVFSTIGIFLFAGLLAIFLPAFSQAFYRAEFKKNDTLALVQAQADYLDDSESADYDPAAAEYIRNLTEEQLMDLMMHTMRYCVYLEDDLNITVDGVHLSVFRADEYSHMRDVKGLFGGGMAIVFGFFACSVVFSVFAIAKKKLYYETCRRVPFYTLFAAFIFLLFVGICAAVNFEAAFIVFHQIFFTGNWAFGSGVMIAMIGNIFTDLVPVIFILYVCLIAVYCLALALYNRRVGKKLSAAR